MNLAEQYELRQLLLIGGGGLGGILGSLLGAGLSTFAPELGIPLAIGSGAGGALGQTAQGLVQGKPVGQALTSGLESGAISGGLAGLGELATTGDFLGVPGAGAAAGGAAGAAAPEAASLLPAEAASAAPITPVAAAPLTTGTALTGAAAPAMAGAAPAAGAGVGSAVPFTASVGSQGADVAGALPTITQQAGAAAPQTLSDTTPMALSDTVIGSQDFADTATGGGLMSFIKDNPGLLLSAGGLGAAMLQGNRTIPGLPAVQNSANLLQTQGAQNINALTTGQLPPGAQAGIDASTQAAKAQTAETFARLGMSGSTSEAQALAAVDQQAAANQFKDLQAVSDLGLREIGASSGLYKDIMTTQLQQDQATQEAIARLAAALGGATGVRGQATGQATA